jgi:hypothetical protein
MVMLKDTPFTQGLCEFAGWNSRDDVKVARGEYEYENASVASTNEYQCDDGGYKGVDCFEGVDLESSVYWDLGEPDRCETCFKIWKNSKDAEEYVKLVGETDEREFCAVKEWVRESVGALDVEKWDWDGDDHVLTIYNGEDTERYSTRLTGEGLVVTETLRISESDESSEEEISVPSTSEDDEEVCKKEPFTETMEEAYHDFFCDTVVTNDCNLEKNMENVLHELKNDHNNMKKVEERRPRRALATRAARRNTAASKWREELRIETDKELQSKHISVRYYQREYKRLEKKKKEKLLQELKALALNARLMAKEYKRRTGEEMPFDLAL